MASKWNMASVSSMTAAAEYLREKSGALLVLVVRPEDVAFAVHAEVAPADALSMVEVTMPDAMQRLAEHREAVKVKRELREIRKGMGR